MIITAMIPKSLAALRASVQPPARRAAAYWLMWRMSTMRTEPPGLRTRQISAIASAGLVNLAVPEQPRAREAGAQGYAEAHGAEFKADGPEHEHAGPEVRADGEEDEESRGRGDEEVANRAGCVEAVVGGGGWRG